MPCSCVFELPFYISTASAPSATLGTFIFDAFGFLDWVIRFQNILASTSIIVAIVTDTTTGCSLVLKFCLVPRPVTSACMRRGRYFEAKRPLE